MRNIKPNRGQINPEQNNYVDSLKRIQEELLKSIQKYLKRIEYRMGKKMQFRKGDLALVRTHRVSNRKDDISDKLLPPIYPIL